ncbi:MAG TPA: hypothetical protein VJM82_04400 [Nitrospiraceae bacterium]|nr:hypothetical protein [Nitrospiraceae bacterium]
MARHLALPKSAFEDVKSVIRLDADKLRALADFFGTAASIRPSSPDFVRNVAERLDLDMPTAESIVLVCQFLLTVVEEGNPSQEILNDVREFVAQHASAEDENLVAAMDANRKVLEYLLTPKPARSRALKVRYLSHGLHPAATAFRTVCELRPVFEAPDGKDAIVGYVPTILLEVKLSDLEGDDRTMVVQLSPSTMNSLKEAVKRAETKLAVIQTKFGTELLGE